MRGTFFIIATGLIAATLVAAAEQQKADPPPAFEAASIKANRSAGTGSSISFDIGRLTATNVSPFLLILNAYNVREYQVPDPPSWTRSDRYDVTAVARVEPNEPPDLENRRLQALLTERFQLQVHHEQRELPIYALVRVRPDRLGTKLTASPPGDGSRVAGSRGGIKMVRGSLTTLAGNLASIVGRPVVDRTGLTGAFDLELTWAPDVGTNADAADPNAPSIFTAVQDQLGLKLESTRGPVDVLLIDRIERPTPD